MKAPISGAKGEVVVVIVWKFDLELHEQSVPITINVVNSNLAHGEVSSMQHYVIKFVSDKSVIFTGYSGFLHQ